MNSLSSLNKKILATVAAGTIFQNIMNPYRKEKIEKQEDTKQKLNEETDIAFIEEERKRVNERVELIKKTPLKDFMVVSKEYDTMVSKLNRLNQAISKITPSSDTRFNILMDELKFTILYRHLEKASQVKTKEGSNSFTGAINSAASDVFNTFHMAGWCGANTPVLQMLEKQGGMSEDMFKMSKICRMHDLRYTMARNRLDIHKADLEMLGDILDTFTIRGIKQGIRNTLNLGIMPVAAFKDYIISLLLDFADNPLRTITTELMGQGILGNIVGGMKALDYIRLQPQATTWRGMATDLLFVQERVLAILGFGAIGMKLLYDISIGKATNTIYGYEETRFNLDEIKYILDDINKIQNERLEEIGFEPVVLSDVLNYSENEIDSMADVVEEVEPVEELTDVLDVDEEAEIKKQIEYLESFNDEIYEL